MKTTKKQPSSGSQPKAKYRNDSERWEAVVRRDTEADGRFYYSVKTTGVYCRPSCGARLARRENVLFHNTAQEAERAGYRPCQRCRPTQESLENYHAEKVAHACRMMETAENSCSLALLAREAGMSPFHFHRIFTKVTGLTPKAYAVACRAERIRRELPRQRTVTAAIYEAGFNSNGRFYAKSSQLLGMAAKRFRQGGPGETIRFAVKACSLGLVLAGASEKGICAIILGDNREELTHELKRRFRRARLVEAEKSFTDWVEQVVNHVEEPNQDWHLPLNIRGTAFQRRVWQALQGIPAGLTASYAEVAARIGAPKAVRAVASACAANSIAVAIPCHRVVRTDGSLSGYRWGVERKRVLLQREAQGRNGR